MKTRVNIIFVYRKPRLAKGEKVTDATVGTLYLRITVRGKDAHASTSIQVAHSEWDSASSRIKGRSEAARIANEYLTKTRDQINDFAADLHRQGKAITATRLMMMHRHDGATVNMIELFDKFLEEQKGLIGIEISKSTATAHRVRYGNLCQFLEAHKNTDLRPEEFTANMADKMLYWLIRERGHKRNTALKNLQNVSQVLTWGVRREYLDKNPMALYQYRLSQPGEIKYLTVGEMGLLRGATFTEPLARVRDCFLFQCWTGLAYADLYALDLTRDAEYQTDGQGIMRRLLRVRRQKSTMHHGYECIIPLLPEAERLLQQYGDELPVPCNAVYNRFLKDIGQQIGIPPDKMTSHVGRKTAGVLMLNMGIRMEVVSKFLGHSSVRMTEKVYAKILDNTLVNEFGRVFGDAPVVAPVLEIGVGPVQVVGHAKRKLPPPPARKAKRTKPTPLAEAKPKPAEKAAPKSAQERPASADLDPFGLLEMRQRWA